jgi:polar amino acid transport system substrate-binding protein
MRTRMFAYCAGLVFLLSGCGGDAGPAAPGPSATAGTEDALARVKRAGVLKWGADPSGGAPFAFTDPQDPAKVIGFEVDFMDKFAAHMGMKHELIRADWDGLLDDMLAGRTDMVVNGIEINEARLQKVDFSAPYYIYKQQLTVRAADKDKYRSLDDLKGKVIGTLSGAEANNVLTRAGFDKSLQLTHKDSLTPYDDLDLNRCEAVLQEDIIADFYAGKNAKLFNVPATFAPGKYGIAVRKGDPALRAEADRVLALMKQNGELAEIYKKWNMWNERQKELGVEEKK